MHSRSANLGNTLPVVTLSASTIQSMLSDEEREPVGITPGLIRTAGELENRENIIGDVEQGLE